MTIRPGEEWGRPAGDLQAVAHADDDADLARQLARGAGGPFVLAGGDLHRAVGAPGPRSAGVLLPVDVLEVSLDGAPAQVAVAHVVARLPGPFGWWHGPIVAVCNVDFIGTWNVAPRAHPNDGRADLVEVSTAMGVRSRWQARRRLPQGTHVPHPDIATRSVKQATFEFDRPLTVRIDGKRAGTARSLSVVVVPDRFELLV